MITIQVSETGPEGQGCYETPEVSNPVLTRKVSGCDVIIILAKEDAQWSS